MIKVWYIGSDVRVAAIMESVHTTVYGLFFEITQQNAFFGHFINEGR